MKNKKVFVSIAGNIGSGKSSLTKLIADEFNWKPYYERVNDNPYLKDFYSDMNRWSFNLQVFFLSHRFKTHIEILKNKRDYDNYRKLFKEMISFLQPPDLLIYLRSSLPKLVRQIKLRGREFEKNLDENYLSRLNESYEDWINEYKSGECLIIESDKMDFVNREKDFNKIIKLIKSNLSV